MGFWQDVRMVLLGGEVQIGLSSTEWKKGSRSVCRRQFHSCQTLLKFY